MEWKEKGKGHASYTPLTFDLARHNICHPVVTGNSHEGSRVTLLRVRSVTREVYKGDFGLLEL